ncbi:MAG: hypothetical protein ACI90V_003500 [Bacillariaceae sp.]|jgi:hypothetical protein
MSILLKIRGRQPVEDGIISLVIHFINNCNQPRLTKHIQKVQIDERCCSLFGI